MITDGEIWYQIRIKRKGEIEIFQNVFTHNVVVQNGKIMGIEIKYSSTQNQGNYTISHRPPGWYEIAIIDNPTYEPEADHPQNISIIVRGGRQQK